MSVEQSNLTMGPLSLPVSTASACLFAVISICMPGCTRQTNLDRAEAARILRELPAFKTPPEVFRLVEGEHCFPHDFDKYPELFSGASDSFRKYSALKSLGLVDLERRPPGQGECSGGFTAMEVVAVFLTDAGKARVSAWRQHPESGWEIPLATKTFSEVTGVTYPDQSHQVAMVEFSWALVPTDLGRSSGVSPSPRGASLNVHGPEFP